MVTAGSDKGKEVVIREVIDDSFVKISGERVKERRSSIKHLEPTGRTSHATPTKVMKPRKEKPEQKKAERKQTKKTATKKKA
jgi:ribosomal protein L14E/L6E/L27E